MAELKVTEPKAEPVYISSTTVQPPKDPTVSHAGGLTLEDWPTLTTSPQWEAMPQYFMENTYQNNPDWASFAERDAKDARDQVGQIFWDKVVVFDEDYKGLSHAEKNNVYRSFHGIDPDWPEDAITFSRTGSRPSGR